MNKPVAWMHKEATAWLSCTNQHPETELDEWIPLYTHQVKEHTTTLMESRAKIFWNEVNTHPVELTNEVYFCSRCGKRLGDGIHTCTPPADILRKAQEK